MAQNWNVKQAYAAIKNGEKDSMIDIGRRFPLAMAALIKVGESDAIENLFNTFPDHLTMRKIENALREGVKVDDSDNDVEEEAVTPESEETEETAAEEAGEIDYKKMSGRQVYELLRDKGLYKDCVAKMGGGNKKQMLEYIEKYGLDGGSEEAEEETEEEKSEGYEAMSAMELFKECKKRGIKIKPRQKAAVYVEALKKDDAAKAESETEEEESWEEEDQEEKKPAKKPVAKPKATVKKPAPKKEDSEEEDDDDDWNI